MRIKDEDFDKILNKLVASTRSPRGRFSAENSWKMLERRLFVRRNLRTLWIRVASTAAIVLLCVASWAAYQYIYLAPIRQQEAPTATSTTTPSTQRQGPLVFKQQPLQEIARQLSATFNVHICIEGDSLQNYRMTATFQEGENLTEILDLLKEAGNFTYIQANDTITLTSKLN